MSGFKKGSNSGASMHTVGRSWRAPSKKKPLTKRMAPGALTTRFVDPPLLGKPGESVDLKNLDAPIDQSGSGG